MPRLTNSLLDARVNQIARITKTKLYIQSQSAGAGSGLQLFQINPDSSEHCVSNGLLTRNEMLHYLNGMIDGLENFEKPEQPPF